MYLYLIWLSCIVFDPKMCIWTIYDLEPNPGVH